MERDNSFDLNKLEKQQLLMHFLQFHFSNLNLSTLKLFHTEGQYWNLHTNAKRQNNNYQYNTQCQNKTSFYDTFQLEYKHFSKESLSFILVLPTILLIFLIKSDLNCSSIGIVPVLELLQYWNWSVLRNATCTNTTFDIACPYKPICINTRLIYYYVTAKWGWLGLFLRRR